MIRTLLDFVYPRLCLACRNPLTHEEDDLCRPCKVRIERADPASSQMHDAKTKLAAEGTIDDLVCAYVLTQDSPLRPLIDALKHGGQTSIGRRLGRDLGCLLVERGVYADVVLPIPMERSRENPRGYNQAFHIAEGVSERTAVPVSDCVLIRSRGTEPGLFLNRIKRRSDDGGNFALRRPAAGVLAGWRCLLVDDVLKTGATILRCASVLKRAGAGSVVACVVASSFET